MLDFTIADLKELNLQARRIADALDRMVPPPLMPTEKKEPRPVSDLGITDDDTLAVLEEEERRRMLMEEEG